MGSWFTKYFVHRGIQVLAFDIKKDLNFLSDKVCIASSIRDSVTNADLVLVCVPVNATPQIIVQCEKHMKTGAVIAEISSVKQKSFPALRQARADLYTLCIHPMFGPGANEKEPTKILLIPVRNEQTEQKIANEIFEKARIEI